MGTSQIHFGYCVTGWSVHKLVALAGEYDLNSLVVVTHTTESSRWFQSTAVRTKMEVFELVGLTIRNYMYDRKFVVTDLLVYNVLSYKIVICCTSYLSFGFFEEGKEE